MPQIYYHTSPKNEKLSHFVEMQQKRKSKKRGKCAGEEMTNLNSASCSLHSAGSLRDTKRFASVSASVEV